ncbi:hypothetical protein SLS58_011259 [Diplodia intermedia]|uniref:RING-type domain-containing protein n=1 Tax=Diplodia intermedia TaxID=856260 RepID=A0ABR3T0R7_9PEZI
MDAIDAMNALEIIEAIYEVCPSAAIEPADNQSLRDKDRLDCPLCHEAFAELHPQRASAPPAEPQPSSSSTGTNAVDTAPARVPPIYNMPPLPAGTHVHDSDVESTPQIHVHEPTVEPTIYLCRAPILTIPFCGHSFGAACFLRFLRTEGIAKVCPLCRGPIAEHVPDDVFAAVEEQMHAYEVTFELAAQRRQRLSFTALRVGSAGEALMNMLVDRARSYDPDVHVHLLPDGDDVPPLGFGARPFGPLVALLPAAAVDVIRSVQQQADARTEVAMDMKDLYEPQYVRDHAADGPGDDEEGARRAAASAEYGRRVRSVMGPERRMAAMPPRLPGNDAFEDLERFVRMLLGRLIVDAMDVTHMPRIPLRARRDSSEEPPIHPPPHP